MAYKSHTETKCWQISRSPFVRHSSCAQSYFRSRISVLLMPNSIHRVLNTPNMPNIPTRDRAISSSLSRALRRSNDLIDAVNAQFLFIQHTNGYAMNIILLLFFSVRICFQSNLQRNKQMISYVIFQRFDMQRMNTRPETTAILIWITHMLQPMENEERKNRLLNASSFRENEKHSRRNRFL